MTVFQLVMFLLSSLLIWFIAYAPIPSAVKIGAIVYVVVAMRLFILQ